MNGPGGALGARLPATVGVLTGFCGPAGPQLGLRAAPVSLSPACAEHRSELAATWCIGAAAGAAAAGVTTVDPS